MLLDTIFIIGLLIFVIKGYSKGIVVALFSVLAVILGVLGALKLSGAVANTLFSDGGGKWAPMISYAIVFLLIVWIVRLGASAIQKSLRAVSLGWLNRLAGALLYAFLFAFIFSSFLWLFNRMHLLNEDTKQASNVYNTVEPLAASVFSVIGAVLPFAKNVFTDLSQFFDQVNEKIQ